MSASISDLVVALQNAVNAINTGANAVQGIKNTLSAPTGWQQIAGLSHSDPPNIINVKDAPYNALGNGVANDQPAIQSALTAINTNFTGGIVLFPSGTYLIGAPGLTVHGCTMLQGMGIKTPGGGGGGTSITTAGADVALVTFAANCDFGGAKDIFFEGYENAAATQDAVTVTSNNLIMRDVQIKGGRYGMNVTGGAGHFTNVTVQGYTGSVLSNFSSWWINCIFDSSLNPTYDFHQVAAQPTSENWFITCDFSNTGTYSLYIDDPHAYVTMFGCDIANPVFVNRGTNFIVNSCQVGCSTMTLTASGGNIQVVANVGLVNCSITVTAPATRILSANTPNIT